MDGAVAARHDGGKKAFRPTDVSRRRFRDVDSLFINRSNVMALGAVLPQLERLLVSYALCASAAMAMVLRMTSREAGKNGFVKGLVQPLP